MKDLLSKPRPQASATTGLRVISVRTGTATGPTALAAFDAALQQAGVADRNLVRLSSIIPAGAVIHDSPGKDGCDGKWGDRLYVVMAEERVERHHEEAWAGIAWCQDTETGAGVFVEHEGHSEHQVALDLETSLSSLIERRPQVSWGQAQQRLVGIVCESEPVCALAVACYTAEPWPGDPVVDVRDA